MRADFESHHGYYLHLYIMSIIFDVLRSLLGMSDRTSGGLATVSSQLEYFSIVLLVSALMYWLAGAGGAFYLYSPPRIACMHFRIDSLTPTIKLPTGCKNKVLCIRMLLDNILYRIRKVQIIK